MREDLRRASQRSAEQRRRFDEGVTSSLSRPRRCHPLLAIYGSVLGRMLGWVGDAVGLVCRFPVRTLVLVWVGYVVVCGIGEAEQIRAQQDQVRLLLEEFGGVPGPPGMEGMRGEPGPPGPVCPAGSVLVVTPAVQGGYELSCR